MSKVVVITGASSGIGEAAAKVLAQQGNKIVLAARREDRLQKLAREIEAAGGVYAATKFGVRALSESLRQEEAAAGSNIRVTLIAPGAVDTELPQHVSDPEQRRAMDGFYASTAIPAKSVADSIAFAVNMPEHTAINEILLRPTTQVL